MRLTAALLLLVLATSTRAQLNADEAAMVEWIETQTAGIEALVQQTVNINSGTIEPRRCSCGRRYPAR